MIKPKNQHWVPQFYLRHFATPETRDTREPQVWIFSKNDGDPRLVNIKKVAAKRYLYTPKDVAGSRDWTMEEKLSDLETLLSRIWPQIATGYIDLNENQSIRKAIALFVATLHLRHPAAIDQIKEIHGQLIASLNQLPKDGNGNPIIGTVVHHDRTWLFDNSGFNQFKDSGPEALRRMFVSNLRENTTFFAEELLKKRWGVIVADQPVFITTDTPITVMNPSQRFGINIPGTVVSFPLSPTRILIMDDRDAEPNGQYYALGAQGPGPSHLMAWEGCLRFMISPRPTDTVCAEMVAWADAFQAP